MYERRPQRPQVWYQKYNRESTAINSVYLITPTSYGYVVENYLFFSRIFFFLATDGGLKCLLIILFRILDRHTHSRGEGGS
jgi:hypothetical protein